MTLYVDPAGLTGIEGMSRRAGNDVSAARSHFDKHGEISWAMQGLINILRTDMDRIGHDVLSFLDRAGHEALPGTADAVAYARDYYARTDQTAAAQMDATIPGANVAAESRGVPGPATGPSNQLTRFHDVYEPTEHLKGHVEYENGSAYNMEYMPKWHEMISPGAALRTAIYEVTKAAAALNICDRAYDPYEVVLKPLCGDWVGMARVGHVLGQVSACLLEVGSNQSWAAQCVRSAWTGNAGDAASAHLFQTTRALQGAAGAMDKMSAEYRAAAQGAFDFADVIGGLLSSVADAALAAAASGAVAGGAASTGFGLPVAAIAGLVGAVELHRVISGIIEIIDYIGKFDALASTLKSSMGQFGRIDGDYPLPSLPAVPALPH